jgi:uncharacterized protein YjiS (DUF1127 family)
MNLDILSVNPFLLFNRKRKTKAALPQSHKQTTRKDYEKLAELPDYILKDVGITRHQINTQLNKPWWWS